MRLKSIKLAGFKSFVDPTTVHFPGALNAVVGPNGCGKSNVIDAVRWVMGESSVKHLRAESSTDVIFSGSNTRKPVGMASIELIFDNSDGRLTGEYGKYNEISVRRTLSRDLQSLYYLNGTRCRRRDVQDVFLGTGLGSRSYAIIEQGMISRFIEAKPEEMRVYIEEAAGISKYKERRRETENRMRHTKENLERLKDIREELERQLQHLQRQAKAAEQYSELKQEERTQRAELLAIRWRAFDSQYQEVEGRIGQQQNALEAAHAEQRSVEAGIEKQRQAYVGTNEAFQQVQAEMYGVATNIARHEQSIKHQQERAGQLQEDLQAAVRSWTEANAHLAHDQERSEQLRAELESVEPELAALSEKEASSSAALELAEAKMQQWQQSWDDFQHQAAVPRQRAEVEQSRIQHLERAIAQLQQRIDKLQQERNSLGQNPEDREIELLQQQCEQLQERAETHRQRVGELVSAIDRQRERNQQTSHELDQARRKMQELQGRLASLDALQQAALGQKDAQVLQWLEQNGLHKNKRLAQSLKVEKGWEAAVETVLGHHLQAVCVERSDNLSNALAKLARGVVSLIDGASVAQASAAGERLAAKVGGQWNLSSLLGSVLVAEDLSAALALRPQLAAHESVVTRDGIWLGPNWMRLSREVDERGHVLEREQELNTLREQIAVLEEQIESLAVDYDAGMLSLKNHEEARETAQRELGLVLRQHSDLASQLSAKQARLEQLNMRRQRLDHELEESQAALATEQASLAEARAAWQQSLATVEQDSGERERMLAQREAHRQALDEARQQARHDKDLAHRSELRKESIVTQLQALEQGLSRLRGQLESFGQRQAALEEAIATAQDPVADLQQALELELEQRLLLEQKLGAARQAVEQAEADLNQLEQQRIKAERKAEGERGQLEQLKLGWQTLRVQRETLEHQLEEMQQDREALLAQLDQQANEAEWERKIERVQNRIQRLGPINLAAIDEYKTQSERKTYLDAQNADLEEALTTLENAIKKIDRETRTKFKETFDQVNKGLQEIFPKIFGGGHAYLEMTGEDLLDTGVAIMARPPGKRNSTIHLLSGGEKALTAISMVFSIFQLNPAPFCMLDEVDAPLDDANVGRFCRIVEEMSEKVQFIYITHNKLSMEMASHMMGVTMHEPGVSRLVSVDIDEAAALAAS